MKTNEVFVTPMVTKLCPMTFNMPDKTGDSKECVESCAWYIDGECAIATIAKGLRLQKNENEKDCKFYKEVNND